MNTSIKFGFYVSGNATRLTKYLSTFEGHMPVACVVHDGLESSKLLSILDQKDIPYYHINLEDIERTQRSKKFSDMLLTRLSSHLVDYCFCFGSKILNGELLDYYSERIINFHPSLLPAFPGLNSIDQALDYGSILLGNTAHFIDEGIDTGAIIMQSVVPLERFEGYNSVLDLQIPMLHQIYRWISEGRLGVCGRNVDIKNSMPGDGCFVPGLEK